MFCLCKRPGGGKTQQEFIEAGLQFFKTAGFSCETKLPNDSSSSFAIPISDQKWLKTTGALPNVVPSIIDPHYRD